MKPSPKLLRKFIQDGFDFDDHGDEWVLSSPANHRKKKLYINIVNGIGHDFLTGYGYSTFQLFKELGNFATNADTQSFINKFALSNIKDIGMSNAFETPVEKVKEQPIVQRVELPQGTKPLFDNHFTAKQGLSYMLSRGLTRDDIKKYHLSIGTEGKYNRRIIIPFIENNEVIWYQGRHLSPKINPRYLNPAGIDKKALVYNIDAVQSQAVLVEGPIDAMMVDGQAIMGIKASDWQVQKVLGKKPDRLVVCPDNDEPRWVNGNKIVVGYQGAVKTIESFIRAGYPKSQIFVALIEGGKDLNDIGKDKALQLVKDAESLSFPLLIKLRAKGVDVKELAKLL
jgi:hypothetical protein